MEQLVFPLLEPGPPTFANFVAGGNAEAVAALMAAARNATGAAPGESWLLWGPPGVGKTHLAQAVAAEARANGRKVGLVMGSAAEADAARGLDATPERASLIVVDDVDRADASLQGRLFTLFNAVREAGGTFIATSRLPAARTALRDDLRTRLGWGVTLELRALTDGAKADALAAHAHGRGMHLSSEVIGWLLTHAPRDMPTLVAMLEALDRYSLARKRPLTLPLLREWMLSTGKNTSSL